MDQDLTNSAIHRQNILNNPYSLEQIEKATEIRGIYFEGRNVLLKEQVASFFEVSVRTIESYLAKFDGELTSNGYEVIRTNRLINLKKAIYESDVAEVSFGNIKKSPKLGIFDFPSFLNLAMLLVDSDRARLLRKLILDVVIDTVNSRTGGGTKYINQRDEDFIHAWYPQETYRKQFTDALRDHVDLGNFKYPLYTNKVYISIFKENADEYRKVLRLSNGDKLRDTFYSEVLDLVASYECGFAGALEQRSQEIDRKLSASEVDRLFANFESLPHWRPLVERARHKMASRDLAFRDALHAHLKNYVAPLQREEFEKFLGAKSKELNERLAEASDVFKRLKERG
jgi:hypothetical protein